MHASHEEILLPDSAAFAADGWWRPDSNKKSDFKVDGEQFVSRVEEYKQKDHVLMRLGLEDDANLADLSLHRDPLSVIKLDRDKT